MFWTTAATCVSTKSFRITEKARTGPHGSLRPISFSLMPLTNISQCVGMSLAGRGMSRLAAYSRRRLQLAVSGRGCRRQGTLSVRYRDSRTIDLEIPRLKIATADVSKPFAGKSLVEERIRSCSAPIVPRIVRPLPVPAESVGVAMLQARLACQGWPIAGGPSVVAATEAREPSKAFVAPYVIEGKDGAAVVRPAAAFRHKGLDPLLAIVSAELEMGLPMLAKQLKVDTSQQGFLKFRLQDIEWVTVGVGVDRSIPRNPATSTPADRRGEQTDAQDRLRRPGGRMVLAFDWRRSSVSGDSTAKRSA